MTDRRREAEKQRAEYMAKRIARAVTEEGDFSCHAGATDNGKPARFDQFEESGQYDISHGAAVSGMTYEDHPNTGS